MILLTLEYAVYVIFIPLDVQKLSPLENTEIDIDIYYQQISEILFNLLPFFKYYIDIIFNANKYQKQLLKLHSCAK